MNPETGQTAALISAIAVGFAAVYTWINKQIKEQLVQDRLHSSLAIAKMEVQIRELEARLTILEQDCREARGFVDDAIILSAKGGYTEITALLRKVNAKLP